MVWASGLRRVMVNTDSKILVGFLNGVISANQPLFSIVQSCKELIAKDWVCQVNHVFRESNRLASMGHRLNLKIASFDDPPDEVLSIFLDKVISLANVRLFPVV
ncbi:hypothetical protein ACOSQ3_031041 [Xanthoceras sorbifolium]